MPLLLQGRRLVSRRWMSRRPDFYYAQHSLAEWIVSPGRQFGTAVSSVGIGSVPVACSKMKAIGSPFRYRLGLNRMGSMRHGAPKIWAGTGKKDRRTVAPYCLL